MEQNTENRDFSSVIPSAKWMIMWKGHTNIPFAREVAELLAYPEKYTPDFKKRDFTFWASAFGLERRYRSINQLLDDISINNILELSSGYSFRGLEYTRQKGVHYIDTDLPDVIATKKELIRSLKKGELNYEGQLELLPLNALDATGFHEITDHFPPGEIAIVNEGLLAYLDMSEKEILCRIIHDILMERGGYWITADIGLKNKEAKLGLQFDDRIKAFNARQHTEENSFESYQEAGIFFRKMGFVIDREAKVKTSEISSFKYMIRSLTLKQLFKMRNGGKIFATWRLKAV